MNITDHVFEETKIAGQSRCVAETLTKVWMFTSPDMSAKVAWVCLRL